MTQGIAYKECPNCGRAGCEAPYVVGGGHSKLRTGPWRCGNCGWDSTKVDTEKGYVYFGVDGLKVDVIESSPGTILDGLLDKVLGHDKSGKAL